MLFSHQNHRGQVRDREPIEYRLAAAQGIIASGEMPISKRPRTHSVTSTPLSLPLAEMTKFCRGGSSMFASGENT